MNTIFSHGDTNAAEAFDTFLNEFDYSNDSFDALCNDILESLHPNNLFMPGNGDIALWVNRFKNLIASMDVATIEADSYKNQLEDLRHKYARLYQSHQELITDFSTLSHDYNRVADIIEDNQALRLSLKNARNGFIDGEKVYESKPANQLLKDFEEWMTERGYLR